MTVKKFVEPPANAPAPWDLPDAAAIQALSGLVGGFDRKGDDAGRFSLARRHGGGLHHLKPGAQTGQSGGVAFDGFATADRVEILFIGHTAGTCTRCYGRACCR